MLIVKTRVHIQQQLGVISSKLRERMWRRRGHGYNPALLTPDVQRDIGAITACLDRVNRAANNLRRLDVQCHRWNISPEISLRLRSHLLKKEHQAVVQSEQHLMTVLAKSTQPNGALVELLVDMTNREVALRKDLDLLGL